MKRFYLYAGYYELHLTRHKLPAPFVFISGHNKISKAIERAERFDSDAQIIAYADSADEIAKAMGIEKETLIVA